MTYSTFKTDLTKEVERQLPDGKRLENRTITKLNGHELDAMVIVDDNFEAHPTLYYEQLYADYDRGVPMEDLIRSVINVAASSCPEQQMFSEFFLNFEKIRPFLCCKLINTSKNSELLKDMPSIEFLDLSVVFYISIPQGEGSSNLYVQNCFLEEWGKHISELIPIASENTKRLFGKSIRSMRDIFGELTEDDIPDDYSMRDFYVVTTNCGGCGAIYMLDKTMLSEYAERFDCDVLIIPSSIHEIFLCPARDLDRSHVDEIICSVNENELDPVDYLSDHSYLYLRDKKRVVM